MALLFSAVTVTAGYPKRITRNSTEQSADRNIWTNALRTTATSPTIC